MVPGAFLHARYILKSCGWINTRCLDFLPMDTAGRATDSGRSGRSGRSGHVLFYVGGFCFVQTGLILSYFVAVLGSPGFFVSGFDLSFAVDFFFEGRR